MENTSSGNFDTVKIAPDLTVYQDNLPSLPKFRINPVKFFRLFLEIHNELTTLRYENQQLAEENKKLRNHFTLWYINSSIDRKNSNKGRVRFDESKEQIRIQPQEIQRQEVSTQTQNPIEIFATNTNQNITIRLEIVGNSPGKISPAPDFIKTVEVEPIQLSEESELAYPNPGKDLIRKTEKIKPSPVSVATTENSQHILVRNSSKQNMSSTESLNTPKTSIIQIIQSSKPNIPRLFHTVTQETSDVQGFEQECENKLVPIQVPTPAPMVPETSGSIEGAVQVCQKRKKSTLIDMFSRSKSSTPKTVETTGPTKGKVFESSWSRNRRRPESPVLPAPQFEKVDPGEASGPPDQGPARYHQFDIDFRKYKRRDLQRTSPEPKDDHGKEGPRPGEVNRHKTD